MHKARPREFWKIFKRSTGEKVCKASLNDLFEFYKNLNQNPGDANPQNLHEAGDFFNLADDSPLNSYFSLDEKKKAINSLSNNKSPGVDEISNEIIKHSQDKILPILLGLFNYVLDTGMIPDSWGIGIIIPIHKGKGKRKNPENYRGITLLSCVGKLFTSILNQRLNKYLEVNNLLLKNQAGFLKDHGILDHIFTLKSLVDLFFCKWQEIILYIYRF